MAAKNMRDAVGPDSRAITTSRAENASTEISPVDPVRRPHHLFHRTFLDTPYIIEERNTGARPSAWPCTLTLTRSGFGSKVIDSRYFVYQTILNQYFIPPVRT